MLIYAIIIMFSFLKSSLKSMLVSKYSSIFDKAKELHVHLYGRDSVFLLNVYLFT